MLEIERKFLVDVDAWRASRERPSAIVSITQCYLVSRSSLSIRVRVASDGAWLTVKGGRRGATRREYEAPLPRWLGRALCTLARSRCVEKVRHTVWHGDHEWVVDEFEARNQGLVLAEIELASEDEAFDVPPWIGEEVTLDARYYNVNLANPRARPPR